MPILCSIILRGSIACRRAGSLAFNMNVRKGNPSGIVSQLQVKRLHQELANAQQKLEEYEVLSKLHSVLLTAVIILLSVKLHRYTRRWKTFRVLHATNAEFNLKDPQL